MQCKQIEMSAQMSSPRAQHQNQLNTKRKETGEKYSLQILLIGLTNICHECHWCSQFFLLQGSDYRTSQNLFFLPTLLQLPFLLSLPTHLFHDRICLSRSSAASGSWSYNSSASFEVSRTHCMYLNRPLCSMYV